MVLLFQPTSHPVRSGLFLLSLLFSAVQLGWSDPFPAPRIISAGGQCPETVITWTSSGEVPFYLLILFGPQGPETQVVYETRTSFFDLVPGDYSAMVKAGSVDGNDSDFSLQFPFQVRPCVKCVIPTVQVTHADPAVLWPPNGRIVPVSFSGMVTGITNQCSLDRAAYTVTDSQGDSRRGRVQVGSDGNFAVNVSLAARRLGSDSEGRIYTFTVNVENEAGAAVSNPVRVEVPHDQGR